MNLSLALGSGETTLQKLTLGFAAFINGGHRLEPKLVDYIEDRYGKLLGASGNSPKEWRANLLPPAQKEKGEPLADPQSLYQITSILQGVVQRGTGRAAHVPGHTIAGKTGTTNDVKDVWFVGFSKDLVAGVWMGYDTPKPMGAGAGSHMAAKVFSDFMTVALANTKDQPFSVPNGIEFRRVNRQTGTPAAGSDGQVINEAFKRGQKPNQPSVHNQQTTSEGYQQPVEVGGVF